MLIIKAIVSCFHSYRPSHHRTCRSAYGGFVLSHLTMYGKLNTHALGYVNPAIWTCTR